MVRQRIERLCAAMEEGIYEKKSAVRLAFLASVAGESVFFWGPPGVAKSLIARRIKCAYQNASSFDYLMGKFSTPEEIFGPISVRRLRDDDAYERLTSGYLPDADIVFLDEIWKASPPIQNALLTALNEKVYRNGRKEVHLPMKVLLSASNELPPRDEGLHAFWDRFLIRLPLGPIQDARSFEQMILDQSDPYRDPVPEDLKVTASEYRKWQEEIGDVDVPGEVISLLEHIRSGIEKANGSEEIGPAAPIYISDRRWKKIVHILRASAFLNGRTKVSIIDCSIISHCLWNEREQLPVIQNVMRAAFEQAILHPDLDPDPVRQHIEELSRQIDAQTVEHVTRATMEPVLYRGEYVRILGMDESELTLMWKTDYDSLAEEGESDVDLFFYEDETTFSHSRRQRTGRNDGEAEVLIDGEPYRIEARSQERRVPERRPPSQEEMADWDARIKEILAECAAALKRIELLQAEAERLSSAHLFAPSGAKESTYASLPRTQAIFADLKLFVEQQRARYRDSAESE